MTKETDMTKENAIDELSVLAERMDSDVLFVEVSDISGKAVKMGIEALQAQRTCKNIGTDYAECDQFVCSKCGIELQDWHAVERYEDGEVVFHECTFRFCPICGRKVVNNETN